MPYFIKTFTDHSWPGSVGFIVNSITLVTASRVVSDRPWTNYQRHSMRHMNARYERSKARTGNLHDGYSYASPRHTAHSESRSWQNLSRLISRQDQFRNFGRIGDWTIHWKGCCQHVPRC